MQSATCPPRAGCMCIAFIGTILTVVAASAEQNSCNGVDVAECVDDTSPIVAPSILQQGSQRSKQTVAANSVETESITPHSLPFWWACSPFNKTRKDWNDLTQEERQLYLEAVNALKTTPRPGQPDAGPGKNMYDSFTIMHHSSGSAAYAHSGSGFLSWHRKFLLEYEEAIRRIDHKFSCVTLPYVDWSAEMFDCMINEGVGLSQPPCDTLDGASSILTDFGGPGDPAHPANWGTGCVTKGPFAGWVDSEGNCLSRGLDWQFVHKHPFASKAEISEIMQIPYFGGNPLSSGFLMNLEHVHNQAHMFIGGSMSYMSSPADPIFFSHHAYIDKIWANWQDCHDHDEPGMKQALQQDPEAHLNMHEATSDYGKANDPMVFEFQTLLELNGCSKSHTHQCARCVHGYDPWCYWNNWDVYCYNHCRMVPCINVCATHDMHESGPRFFPGWDTTETTPADMHSVYELASGRHYSYSPDEFERYLDEHFPEHVGSCKMRNYHRNNHSLAEVRRYHHTGQPRGDAAKMYALALVDTVAARTANGRNASVHEVLKMWEQKDCSDMAKAANHSDYKKAFNCSVDQPRNLLVWLGRPLFEKIMQNSTSAKTLYLDVCCQ